MASAIFRITELHTHAKHLHYYVRHITETHISRPYASPFVTMYICMHVTMHAKHLVHPDVLLAQEQSREVKAAGSETVVPLLHFAVFTFPKFVVYTVEPLYSGHY